jgi:hypothetical protein
MPSLSPKQTEAWWHLEDPEVLEVFAGGGAGGGKSLFGCLRQIYRRLKYPGTRGFIGRDSFTALRDSTMYTYFKLLAEMGYRSGEHYSYNAQDHTVKWGNGSEQHFRHMAYMPSDPDYNRFGSTEYTDAFVDATTLTVGAVRCQHAQVARYGAMFDRIWPTSDSHHYLFSLVYECLLRGRVLSLNG